MKHYLLFLFVSFTTIIGAQSLTVESIWKSYQFYGDYVAGFTSMKDGRFYSSQEAEGIVKHPFVETDGKSEVLVSNNELKIDGAQLQVSDYQFNEDESKVLILTNQESVYRHSYTAIYYLFDRNTKKLQALDPDHQPQTLAEYSPDGKMVSYIFENNIYVKEIESGKVSQITTDGKRNQIINGTTDWVYEEEFGFINGYAWSPDSRYISYLRFDESAVKDFTMSYYNELYPDLYTFKYPKAGEDNSKVNMMIYDFKAGRSAQLDIGKYEYIPRFKWSGTSNQLVIQTMNRHQNELNYILIDFTGERPSTSKFFTETSDTYIDVDNNLLILNDGKSILRTSESDGYNHIYKLGFDGNQTQITSGNWDVIEFLGIDDANRTIYYTSAETGPIHQSIYRIDISGKKKKCISADSGHNDAQFSNGMNYFIKTWSNANTPPIYSLCKNTGEEIKVLKDNANLRTKLRDFNLSKKEFVTFKGASIELNGWMIKPKDFDPNKKYPVYLNIYGGPGSNMVNDSWGGINYMYHQLLAQSGYIVVSVDPRGTMYRGAKFKKMTYLQLGKLETEDMIAVAQELGKYSYVDASRIGIMGWSYGGFMTSLCMTKGADYFKMGIAVAPVTNWRYYDNIYTERFMRTPDENASGYDDNSPINFVNQLKGKYLLVHGSGDDNVHYQNSMEMVNALVAADKDFELFIYPNKNHGIYGGNTRNHLFRMMYNFTLENL